MPEFTYENLREGYSNLYKKALLVESKKGDIDWVIDNKFILNKKRYQAVESVLKVPWYVIALLHYRESNCNFNTHLHNGDPLSARTRNVPKGRPIKGNPPYHWEESATDAIMIQGLDKIKDWTLSRILYQCEKYNGFGYFSKYLNSPYLWSGTNLYVKGKYASDGVYDRNLIDQQLGCAAILKRLEKQDIILLRY